MDRYQLILVMVAGLVVEHGRNYVLKEAVFRRKKLVVKKRVVNVVIGRVKRGWSGSSSSSSVCSRLCGEEVVVNVILVVRVMHVKEEILGEV